MTTLHDAGNKDVTQSLKAEKVTVIPSSQPRYSRISQGYAPLSPKELPKEQADYKKQTFIENAEEGYKKLKALCGEETARALTRKALENQKWETKK